MLRGHMDYRHRYPYINFLVGVNSTRILGSQRRLWHRWWIRVNWYHRTLENSLISGLESARKTIRSRFMLHTDDPCTTLLPFYHRRSLPPQELLDASIRQTSHRSSMLSCNTPDHSSVGIIRTNFWPLRR